MLTSIALILISGFFLSRIFNRLRLPGLLGMIIAGIIIGPYALNLINSSLMNISADLRQIALVIILTRAGLSLNIKDLKKVGRPAVLMCFLPACAEIFGTVLIAPKLFNITLLEAAVMGSVLAAVSPAVIVPRMIKIMENGYGRNHSIPQLILAGASVDDVFVIVAFTVFSNLAKGEGASFTDFFQIPVSILSGIIAGILCGMLFILFLKKFSVRNTAKVLLILSVSFLLLELQNRLNGIVPMSGLIAIMSMGITINQKNNPLASALSAKYNKLWIGAEIILFVLVGAEVNLKYAVLAGFQSVALVLSALIFRMIGVILSLIHTPITPKEKIFCMLSYTPKATVQAAIGALPLYMGLACGETVLTAAVVSILITAPFGAICIDKLYKKLLCK